MNSRPHDVTAGQSADRAVGRVTDAGWHRIGEVDGVALWQWQDSPMIRVATRDDDILRIIGATLNRCEEMTQDEFNEFIAKYLFGGRSGMPSDEDEDDNAYSNMYIVVLPQEEATST